MKPTVHFYGIDSLTNQWCIQKAYGGLWAENATQAVARGVMAEAMKRLDARGWQLILAVHDEILSEIQLGRPGFTPEAYLAEMTARETWFEGLPLHANVKHGLRYRK